MEALKKLLILFLALAVVFCFAACSEDTPDEEDTEPTLNQGDENCEHVFTEWEITKENTCTKKGKQERECELCGKEEEESLLAFGHTYYDGECSECGKEPKECEHSETDTVVMSIATCTEEGVEREVCKLCKAVVEFNYVSAYWHSETETVVIREATCTEDGAEHEICKLCDEVVYEYTLWATGHEDTEYVVITEATCTENGTYQNVCTLCGEVDYEGTIWSEGHSYEYIDAKAPTCTEIGWYSYRQCTVCAYQYNYDERPATGHNYQFGTCTNCGETDSNFSIVTAPGVMYNPLVVNKAEPVSFEALAAKIESFSGEIADRDARYTFTFEVETDGRYYVWLDDVLSGSSISLRVRDALGNQMMYAYALYNGEGKYVDLTSGSYTVELWYTSGAYSAYELHIGHAKKAADVSSYDIVKDKMEFNRQIIQYTFTPAVSGVYFFQLGEMLDSAQMALYVYDRSNAQVGYYGYVSNGIGVKVTLNAGETYTVKVDNIGSSITPYAMYIGKQAQTVMIDGANMVNDSNTFKGQVNVYQFVATSKDCRIDAVNMIDGMQVNIELYNHLNERVAYYSYADNGEGFNYSDLVPGQTYTVKVIQYSQYGDYTLRVLMPKAAVDVTANMGVTDSIEYYGQANYYNITANDNGEMVIKLRVDSYTNGRYVAFYVYDAAGNLIGSDTSVYSGDSVKLSNLTAGETYILRVVYNGNAMEYAISFT